MTWGEFWDLVSQIGGGVSIIAVPLLVAWMSRKSSVETKEKEADAAVDVAAIAASEAPYDKLSARVSALEEQVELLLSHQWVDRAYMRQLLSAWPAGHPLPLPMPPWLAEHYGLAPQHMPTPGSIIEPPASQRTPPRHG